MIDRNKVIKELGDLCEYMFHEYKVCYHGDENDTYNRFLTVNNAINLLKEQDSCENCAIAIEDRQPVVRCRDCKYWLPMNRFVPDYHSGRGECELNCWVRDSDWFCADGERKSDG